MKVYRFGEVKIETGFLAALYIVLPAKSGQRNRFNGSFAFGLGNQIIAAAIWQSDIGENNVKIF